METHKLTAKVLAICAALGYRWDGRRSRPFFQTREGSYNSESLISFLSDLHGDLGGQKAILVWDGLPAHKSRAMKEYLRRERHWLRVERLPGYAPDLNPVETLWGNIKGLLGANHAKRQPCVSQVECDVPCGLSLRTATIPWGRLRCRRAVEMIAGSLRRECRGVLARTLVRFTRI